MAATVDIPVEISSGRMPLNYEDNWKNTFRTMVRRLRGFVPGDKILIGKDQNRLGNTTFPGHDIGPVLQSSPPSQNWYAWDINVGAYVPVIHLIGPASELTIKLTATDLTLNQDQALQNANGTWALLEDIYVPRTTVIINPPTQGDSTYFGYSETPVIDWTKSDNFFTTLAKPPSGTGTTTFSFSGQANGQEITLVVQNLGTDFQTSFPAATQWPGGTQPPCIVSTDPTAQGGSAITVFEFYDINGTVFGRRLDFSPANATPTVDPGGQPTHGNYGGAGNSAPAGFRPFQRNYP